jgi:ketosteroid isomerase-like protein
MSRARKVSAAAGKMGGPYRSSEEVAVVPDVGERDRPVDPEDLGRLFLSRANANDVEGVVALYEPAAVLAAPDGSVAAGTAAIRAVYQALLASRPRFSGEVRPALRCGDLALTSTRFAGGATAEIARRQPDGTWLWVADQPQVAR